MKAFLEPYRRAVHSLILVGSYALGEATRHSDADFLVLLKGVERERHLSRVLFDFEMGRYGPTDEDPIKLQVVPFAERDVEWQFQVGAPLAHSARNGIIIRDDGWFRTLLSRPYPKWPTREYALHAVTRWILWQYYRCAIDLQREIRWDHGPEGFCSKKRRCLGHLAGDILARVISRMLYVALPARGLLPLSKRQAVAMAVKSFGPDARRPVMLAMAILRKERGIYHREFQHMFPFARRLFRECLRVYGPRDPELLGALRAQARLFRELSRDRLERKPRG
jgi:predicted nucleotidyltransferase